MTGQTGFGLMETASYTGGRYLLQWRKQTEIVNSMPGGGAPGGTASKGMVA